MYHFGEHNSRKRIHYLNLCTFSDSKSFIIFENNFITIVSTPNIAENLLLLGYLYNKYPESKGKIQDYAASMIGDFS